MFIFTFICLIPNIFAIKFLFFNHDTNVTGPADTVAPPDSSVILGVTPNVNVYLSAVVTVILKPLEFSYVVKGNSS